jgi:hypothetical protein
MKRGTTDDFIKRARERHADRYEYPNVVYVNCDTPVRIQCKEHGEFSQKPASHLAGQGCMQCAIQKRRRGLSFYIKKFKKIHGDRYDYSKVEDFKNQNQKVTIVCAIHGDFVQCVRDHYQGRGCPACANSTRLTTEEVIARARSVHGDEYDYSKTEYVSHRKKIDIICRRHGVFRQRVQDHLFRRSGCPACGGCVKLTTEDFVSRAKKVHGDTYDYSNTVYVARKSKVDILCREHGVFSQHATNHLTGHGCAMCARAKRWKKE